MKIKLRIVPRALALLALTGSAALAQTYEIRGIVMEVGTTQPVTEANVHVNKDAPIKVGQFKMAHFDPVAELTTDGQGRFMLTVEGDGEYIIAVDKEGFFGSSSRSAPGAGLRQANVFLNESNPEAEVELALGRTGEVSGRFIDADTGDPAAGMRVLVTRPYYFRGVMMAGNGPNQMMTREDGSFTISGLPPGDYAVATEPFVDRGHNYMSEIGADFDETALETVERGYPSAFFPGGPSLDRALLFSVPSAARLDVGTFRIRKVDLYDARIQIADDNCPAGTAVFVNLYKDDTLGRTYDSGTLKGSCGGAFLIQNLEAGNYRLYGRTKPDEKVPNRLMADMEVSVVADNLYLRMFLQPGATLEGRIIPAEGAGELDLQTLSPQLNIIHSMMTAIDLRAPGVAENGRFSQDDTRPATYEVVVNHLPPGAYISEVSYKGVVQPRLQFDFAGDGLVEIEVDTRSGTLSGTVGDRDGPIPNATVVATPWPVPRPDERRLRVSLLKADEEGHFTTALPPGDYRLFALPQEEAYRVDMPGVIERLAARGEKLEAERNGAYNFTLKLEDPSR